MEAVSDDPPAHDDTPHSPRTRAPDRHVAVRAVLDFIAAKWTYLIIEQLGAGPHRNSELARALPESISQRMLTRTLRQLERDGLINRTVHAEVPVRVVYELGPLGITLVEPTATLASWALDHCPTIQDSRRNFDAGRVAAS